MRPHAAREVPNAGDDVRGGAGTPAEAEEEERQALSPRVALAAPSPLLRCVTVARAGERLSLPR